MCKINLNNLDLKKQGQSKQRVRGLNESEGLMLTLGPGKGVSWEQHERPRDRESAREPCFLSLYLPF